jgi:Fur family ferric uptake transcriptional regulator
MQSSNTLKSIGSKNTNARQAVLNVFEYNTKPLSIKDIMNLSLVKSNESTIYRIVNFFVKEGILTPVFIQKDITFYELAHTDDHHHIVCTQCKKVTDFHGCGIEQLIKNALKQNPEFKKVESHSLELFGICKSCA